MILHVDMDAFYASIEERERSELVGQPVVVGGSSEGRGVVSAANYEARKFGVHSAMPAVTARRLCPHAVFLPVRMDLYAAVARQIRDIFHRYTPLVEPLSLDEAFLDVSGSRALFGPAETIGRRIKDEIRNELHLVPSVGVAPRKFIAKIASDLEKPDGFVVVSEDEILSFLAPLPISRMWGVGKKACDILERLGVRTIGQLRELPLPILQDKFGRSADHLARLAAGIDPRSVVPDHQAKQISHETTFAHDIDDAEVLEAVLIELTEQVARRLRRHDRLGRTVQIKLRFGDFRTITRAHTLVEPTDTTQEIWNTVKELFAEHRASETRPLRLVGVSVSGLQSSRTRQMSLFDEEQHHRQQQLDAATDEIRDRFGKAAVRRASGISNRRQPPREN